MNNTTTIEIGHKASPFAKWLFLGAVQEIAKTLKDTSTNSWNTKKIYELTKEDIQSVREFVLVRYESDIHTLLTYGGKPAPVYLQQFATLQLGSCQMTPESYYTEVKKLHEYYQVLGVEGTGNLKKEMYSYCGDDLAYDRGIEQIGLDTAAQTGIEHMFYITHLLIECEESWKLATYYTDIIKLLQSKHHTGKPIAHIIAILRAKINERDYSGIHMMLIIETFFEQYKSNGATKLQEFLEAFCDTSDLCIIDLIDDFKVPKHEKYPDISESNNQRFINKLVAIQDFQKLKALYQRSKENKTLTQRKELLLHNDSYRDGVAYLNSVPLDTLQQQLEHDDLKKHYITFQNI